MKQADFKINNFDLLRLLAATQVVFDHFYQHIHLHKFSFYLNETFYLFPGIPVFFMISGYLVSASYERNNNIRIYFKNRALRIFPGLWVCIFITIAVISLTGVSFLNSQTLMWLPCQLIGLIYTPGFLSHYGFGSYNGSLWSITVELQFYLVLPILYWLFSPRKKNTIYWFIALIIVFGVFNCLFVTQQYRFQKLSGYTFLPHIYLFLFGVVLQKLQLYRSKFIYNKALYWIIIYLVFIYSVSGALVQVSNMTYTYLKNILLGFLIVSLAYTLPGFAKKLLHSNDVSYGIYIYHGLIMTVIVQEGLSGKVSLFTLLLMTFAVAILSWFFVERPFIRRKEKTIKATEKE